MDNVIFYFLGLFCDIFHKPPLLTPPNLITIVNGDLLS
jgi:hypothetical protein